MDLNLVGKRVVVTGGSSGIGHEVASVFLEEGASVVIGARDETKRQRTVSELANLGHIAEFELDIRSDDAVRAFFQSALEDLGGIDILVNNAGAAVPKDHLSAEPSDWVSDLDYKLVGYVRCTKAALASMIPQASGSIVMVAGTAGREPNPWTTTSGVVNAGLCNYTKTLAHSLGGSGIRVNAICPGPVQTARWNELAKKDPGAAEALIQEIPLGRAGVPRDLANPVVFLASEAAMYINGAALTVDGGRSRSVAF